MLIQGTGGVSLFALQFARLCGARRDRHLQQRRQAGPRHRASGAGDGINYKTNPDWENKVRELTGGVGVDHIVEVGGAGTLPQSLKAVRLGGTISLIGVLSGGGEVNPMPILMKNIRVQGIFVGSARDVRGHEPGHRPAQAQAGCRSRVSVRRSAGGAAVHGERGSFWEDCDSDLMDGLSPFLIQSSLHL